MAKDSLWTHKPSDALRFTPGDKVSEIDTDSSPGFSGKRDDAETITAEREAHFADLQEMLYAHDRYSLLVIFQAMDAAGKDGVLVRHLMSHTSGVSGLDQPAVLEDLYDWEGSTSRMASQAPWWEPGTASGYHALNFGHLLGEVLRRITGRSLKQFVAEEIAGPLGADFTIGAPESEVSRIAPVVAPPPLPFDLENIDFDSPLARTMTGPLADADAANTSAWRAADIGGANGHGNARSLVRMLSALSLGGTVDGVELLDPATIERTFEVQADGIDLVLGVPFRFGIGFGLTDPGNYPDIPGGRMLHWGGWGGSFIIMDLDRRTTFSYTMNKMAAGIVGSPTGEAYLRAGYAALGVDVPGHVVAL